MDTVAKSIQLNKTSVNLIKKKWTLKDRKVFHYHSTTHKIGRKTEVKIIAEGDGWLKEPREGGGNETQNERGLN